MNFNFFRGGFVFFFFFIVEYSAARVIWKPTDEFACHCYWQKKKKSNKNRNEYLDKQSYIDCWLSLILHRFFFVQHHPADDGYSIVWHSRCKRIKILLKPTSKVICMINIRAFQYICI
jgi:hypothetical protein